MPDILNDDAEFENWWRATTQDKVVLISEAAKLVNNGELSEPYPTKYDILDNSLLKGFRAGDMVIITGHSGHGKTLFNQSLCYNFTKQMLPCLYFSYEVPLNQLWWKFKQMGVDDQFMTYAPMSLDNNNVLGWVEKKIKEGFDVYGTKMIFIDNSDFVLPTKLKDYDSEVIMFRNLMVEMKQIAIKLGVVIFVNHHIKKDIHPTKIPSLQDIYGSAKVYQLADFVLAVWRVPENISVGKKLEKSIEVEDVIYTNKTKVIILKNRLTGELKSFTLEYLDNRLQQNYVL